MKPETVAVVFTDADTGKPYAAVLNESETRVIMAMLSGLQDGAIRAREVIPFELRSVPRTVAKGTGQYSGGVQQLAKGKPAKKFATCNGKGTIDKDKCNIPCPACSEEN